MTFIDLGAYDGDTVKEFLAEHPDAEVYAFEPNTDLKWQVPGVRVSRKAAWVFDGEIEIAIDPTEDDPMGSTVMRQKRELWELGKHRTVKCFDFSEWLRRKSLSVPVIVKMDIEGAEFPVLEQMIEDGTDQLIDELRVEWHQGKIDGKSTEDVNQLKRRLRCKVVDWR